MQKKWILIGCIVLALVGGGGYYYHQSQLQAKETVYVTGQVKEGSISSKIHATGTINPVNYVDVSTNMPGTLEKVLVAENQHVEKGSIIAYIDDAILKSNEEAAFSLYQNAQKEYDRQKVLYEEGAIPLQTLDNARVALDRAKSDYEKANKSLSESIIIAPMSGTIIGTPLKPGQTISTGLSSQMIIATIADLSHMEIYLSVDETDIAQVHPHDKVTFTVDAYPNETFTGEVASISKGTKGNMGSINTNVVYYTVKVAVPETVSEKLLPTMTARAVIYGKTVEHATLVPLTAVRNDAKGDYVYRIVGGKPERQNVVTGLTDEGDVQIVEGVSVGDEIVVSGNVMADTSSNKGGRLSKKVE